MYYKRCLVHIPPLSVRIVCSRMEGMGVVSKKYNTQHLLVALRRRVKDKMVREINIYTSKLKSRGDSKSAENEKEIEIENAPMYVILANNNLSDYIIPLLVNY